MNIQELLNSNEYELIICRPEDTVVTVAALLETHNIGALPVCDRDRKLVGMISERDIVRSVSRDAAKINDLLVKDIMTHKVLTCTLEHRVSDAMTIMNKAHIRHLPVMKDDELLGIISSRDTISCALNAMELERNVLRDYAITR